MGIFTTYANPAKFVRIADRLLPFVTLAAVVFTFFGIYLAFYASPPDWQQKDTVRIMYVHVPSAWVGMGIYVAMAGAAAVGLVARHALADVFCVAAAPVGATFVAVCLITGSLWGKPTWGAWWAWDARLTSVLILFLLYCGYIVLRHSFDDDVKGARAGAVLLLVGVVNIPIIKFSVEWWNTLHQPASILRVGGSTIDGQMLRPLLTMGAAFFFYATSLLLLRMKTVLLQRKTSRHRTAS